MKIKTNIKLVYTFLPLFGLIALVLLSPCKIRNFIQSELGIAPSELTNKNQTTISNSNCIDFEVSVDSLVKKKSKVQQLPIITPTSDLAFASTSFNTNNSQSYKVGHQAIHPIPFYILYQNFKDYL